METNHPSHPPFDLETALARLSDRELYLIPFIYGELNGLMFELCRFTNLNDAKNKVRYYFSLAPDSNKDDMWKKILNRKNEVFLHDKEFDIIPDHDYRGWLFMYIYMNINSPINALADIPVQAAKNSFIGMFDAKNTELDSYHLKNKQDKQSALLHLYQKTHSNRVPDKLIRWLDPNNHIQMKFAFKYLKNKEIILYNIETDDLEQNFYMIMSSVDYNHLICASYCQKTLVQMKRAWDQRTFREQGKEKQPYHLPLTKKSRRDLKKLASLLNEKENLLIERLIAEECDRKRLSDY